MNKSDLVSAIAKQAELTKNDADKALKAVIETIIEGLNKGNKISLLGFGTFSMKKVKARTGRNPATGATIQIPAKTKKVFKFSPLV
jgi:DNA-binding protein HU-beta